MSNTRKKLDRMAEIEQRNQQRLARFKSMAEDPETEHKREAAIARYMHELNID